MLQMTRFSKYFRTMDQNLKKKKWLANSATRAVRLFRRGDFSSFEAYPSGGSVQTKILFQILVRGNENFVIWSIPSRIVKQKYFRGRALQNKFTK